MPSIPQENGLQAHSRKKQKSRGLSTAELHSQQRRTGQGSEKRANEAELDVGKPSRALEPARHCPRGRIPCCRLCARTGSPGKVLAHKSSY